MQITGYKPRYIEKIVETPEGVFSARFVVVSEGDSFKLQFVDMVPLQKNESLANSTFLLSAPKIKQVFSQTLNILAEIISPFSNFNFFVSQPTRAPSVK